MPVWLSDPSPTVYVFLTMIGVAAVWYWFRSSQTWRVTLTVLGILLAIIAVVVIDILVESPREEAVRKLQWMAASANAREWDRVFAEFAEQFRYHGSDRSQFRSLVVPNAERHQAQIQFKSFDRESVAMLGEGHWRLGFIAQVTSPSFEIVPYYVEAEFLREPDGQYRMLGFQVYNIARRVQGGEETVPGLP